MVQPDSTEYYEVQVGNSNKDYKTVSKWHLYNKSRLEKKIKYTVLNQ